MAEPKPLASLSSGLLARKGTAQPAMRRPMLGFGPAPVSAFHAEDLGWNDMGFETPPPDSAPVPTPVPAAVPAAAAVPLPPVVVARAALAERIGEIATPRASASPPPRKAAFTLRLDPDRHLKLRLAGVVTGRSAQHIVTQALDDFLNDLPEIDRLTQQLPPRAADRE